MGSDLLVRVGKGEAVHSAHRGTAGELLTLCGVEYSSASEVDGMRETNRVALAEGSASEVTCSRCLKVEETPNAR